MVIKPLEMFPQWRKLSWRFAVDGEQKINLIVKPEPTGQLIN